MAEAAEQKENGGESPSMEEILKSIRGVISGDEAAESAAPPAAVPAAPAASVEDADEEILELTEMELTEEAAAPADAAAATTAGGDAAEKSVLDDIDAAIGEGEAEKKEEPKAEPEKQPEPAAVAPEPAAAEPEAAPASDILEASGDEPAESAVEPAAEDDEKTSAKNKERLLREKVADESSETLRSLVSNIPRTQVSSPYTKGGVTLEELTIEAMRPFLAEWLNENLPTIVKQIVSKEIKKLIPEDDDK